MNAPCVDLRDMLEADSSLGLVYATNLFIALIPPEPDYCVTLIDSGGNNPADRYTEERSSVQIMMRGNKFKYIDAYNKIRQVKDYLCSLSTAFNVVWNETRYISIHMIGDIISLGYDSNNRPLLSCNLSIRRTE